MNKNKRKNEPNLKLDQISILMQYKRQIILAVRQASVFEGSHNGCQVDVYQV